MKITCLMENTACREGLACRHGLSLYIETAGRRLVSDFGPDDSFIENAAALGVDVSAADAAFLSHGHHDHGDGLAAFLKANSAAPVYMAPTALSPRFALHPGRQPEYIGLRDAEALAANGRIRPVSGTLRLDGGVTVFSCGDGQELVSETNAVLMEPDGAGGFIRDAFAHEQNLALTAPDGSMALVAGCAHRGIVNIMERFTELFGKAPRLAVSGFHLTTPQGAEGYSAITPALGRRLLEYPTKFYTCHCTGLPAYAVLKDIMGDRLEYLSAGGVIEF